MRPIRWRALLPSALVAATLAGCGGGGPSDVRPTNVADACALLEDNPHWAEAINASHDRWGGPPEIKLAIIWRESTFRHDARPPGRVSSAYGYSQALDGTWEWYRTDTGNLWADRTEFEDAIDFVGWYMDKSRRINGLPLTDAYNQYLAYHEGHRGFELERWRQKPFLVRAAQQVNQQARAYADQLRRCGRA